MKTNGGPAFPRPTSEDRRDGDMPDGNEFKPDQVGMTLRDYLAAKAMPAYITDQLKHGIVDCQEVASFSYEMASAMIAEREK